jgi:hypothetical protein
VRELFKEHTFEAKVHEFHTLFIIHWVVFVELDDYPGITFECATKTEYSKDTRKSKQETPYSMVAQYDQHFSTTRP